MSFPPIRRPDKPSPLEEQVQNLRKELSGSDPHILADRTGALFQPGPNGQPELQMELFGQCISITFPEYEVQETQSRKTLGVDVQALLLYHLLNSQGRSLTGRWISFAELPDGRFYNQAFQGYTGQELVRAFGNDQLAFEKASLACGGQKQDMGDAAYTFQALPRIPLMVIYWQGDDEFPPSVKVLFDASIPNHLPTDVCAILGSMLARRIKKAKGIS